MTITFTNGDWFRPVNDKQREAMISAYAKRGLKVKSVEP